jgi:hypothetical protein
MHRVRPVPLAALLWSLLGFTACVPKPVPARTHPLGEKVVVGRLVYSAFDTQWLNELGEGTDARVPQQRFFLVRIAITNSGSAAVTAPNLSVVDDNGTSYEELSDGEGVPQWIGFLRQIDQSDTSRGNLLFDVPPRHYKLRVSDEEGRNTALIDLPLDFTGNQLPDLGIPVPGKQ